VASWSYHGDTDTCVRLLHHQDSDDFPPVGNTSKTGRTQTGVFEQQQRKIVYLRRTEAHTVVLTVSSKLRITDLDRAVAKKATNVHEAREGGVHLLGTLVDV
jgi:hypothetical protein